MKKSLLLATLYSLFAVVPAQAQSLGNTIDGYVSGDFRLSNNYLWRGLSLSNHGLAVSHSLSYTFEVGAYLGYWVSNVELVNSDLIFDTGIEVDVYAGYKASFDEEGSYGIDFGIQHYFYDVENDYNHNEVYLNVIMTDFTFSYYRGVNIPSSNYYEISWSSELGGDGLTTLTASLGYAQFRGRADDTVEFAALNYMIGVGFYFGSIGDLTVAYSGVFRDTREYGLASVARHVNAARNRAVVSWGISF